MMKRLGFAIFLLFLVSEPVLACAVCGQGRDDDIGRAFFASTVLMSLVPVGMISGTIIYMIRAVRRRSSTLHPVPSEDEPS